MSLEEKLDGIAVRHEELAALMSSGDLNPSDYTALAREYAELSPVVETIKSSSPSASTMRRPASAAT